MDPQSGLPSESSSGPPQKLKKKKKRKYLVKRMGALGVAHENFVLSKMDSIFFFYNDCKNSRALIA